MKEYTRAEALELASKTAIAATKPLMDRLEKLLESEEEPPDPESLRTELLAALKASLSTYIDALPPEDCRFLLREFAAEAAVEVMSKSIGQALARLAKEDDGISGFSA
jgi:hypothetical protein